MNNPIDGANQKFGGKWTEEKLNILESYLDAYTTALKKMPFELWYIDAFAGSGSIALSAKDKNDFQHLIDGSVKRAINISDKQFDKLIFIEKDKKNCEELENLKKQNIERKILIENCDANSYLMKLNDDWRKRRGVLFLDPFATEVKWGTIEKIAALNALDTWILFPIGALSRMLPRSRHPDEISKPLVSSLTNVYGDQTWRDLYKITPQGDLFIEKEYERDKGVEGLSSIYKNKLTKLFGDRFLEKTRVFKNSRNSKIFEFIFCVGHKKGVPIAKKIAEHIVGKI